MTLSAYFMTKSVFDQQGCRALTFALARLSCFKSGKTAHMMKVTAVIFCYRPLILLTGCDRQTPQKASNHADSPWNDAKHAK